MSVDTKTEPEFVSRSSANATFVDVVYRRGVTSMCGILIPGDEFMCMSTWMDRLGIS